MVRRLRGELPSKPDGCGKVGNRAEGGRLSGESPESCRRKPSEISRTASVACCLQGAILFRAMLVAQLMLGAVQLERFCTEEPPFLIARLCRQRNYVDGYFPGARVVENNQDNRSASGVSGLAQRMYAGVRATIDALGQSDSQQLAAIVASSDDAIISKDLNGIIATWNRGAEKLFGYTADEAIGQSITILFPAELIDDEARILARIRLGERIEHYETVRQRKDGQRVQISLTVSPILDANGQVIGAAKIGRDITARKRAEDAQFALYDFADRLFRAGSVEDVYEAALAAIIRALGCDRASILLFDWAGIMKFVASRGLSDRYRQAVEGHSPWTPQSRKSRANHCPRYRSRRVGCFPQSHD